MTIESRSHRAGIAGRGAVWQPGRNVIVGCFRTRALAHSAVSALDRARVPPQGVSRIVDGPEAAAVGSRSFQLWGTVTGLVIGMSLAIFFLTMGGPRFRVPSFAGAFGALFVVAGLGFLGFVCGGAVVIRGRRAEAYRRIVEKGGALVLISAMSAETRPRARAILANAGADDIIDEGADQPTTAPTGPNSPAPRTTGPVAGWRGRASELAGAPPEPAVDEDGRAGDVRRLA